MKLKFMLSLIMAAVVLAVGYLPEIIIKSINTTSYTIPEITQYQRLINCSGTIYSKNTCNIYMETPVIADNIFVEIGDKVKKGQLLANINTSLTKNVIEASEKVNVDVSAADNELLSMAEKYGITAEDVMGYLSDSKIADNNNVFNQTAYIPDTVTSPIDGVITQLNIASNTLSKTSVPIITVSDCNNYYIKTSVSENEIANIKLGDKAEISCIAVPDKEYTGYVQKIYPTATKAASATASQAVVALEIAIDNADENIKEGYTSSIKIITSQNDKKVMIIPFEAVRQDENNVEYVYVYENAKAVRKNITTGLELYYGVEVTSGLNVSDIVIYNPDIINKTDKMVFIKGREYVKR